ncbi:hypothetical protein LCGC14_0598840 [marine sediment metagenome]|uniref:Uncharacterized protein n=1 Tax=marine sediment metagenome TaxID=412755 RepID=A0A0F9TXG3_9ZZZZ
MPRVNFLYIDIKVYPASIKEGRHTGYELDTIMIAEQPVLSCYVNLFDLYQDGGWLEKGLIDWIQKEMLNKGKELVYRGCPKAPK